MSTNHKGHNVFSAGSHCARRASFVILRDPAFYEAFGTTVLKPYFRCKMKLDKVGLIACPRGILNIAFGDYRNKKE